MRFETDPESYEFFTIDVPKEVEITEKYGIVAIMDALGTKKMDIQKSKEFAKSLTIIKRQANSMIPQWEMLLRKNDNNISDNFKVPLINFYVFQDTIIATLETMDSSIAEILLDKFSNFVGQIFYACFLEGIFLRGAVSIGNYIEYENFVFGPAIYDAAEYFEKINFIGMVAAPNCGKHLDSIQIYEDSRNKDKNSIDYFHWLFSNIDVPLNNNTEEKLWVINWPFWLSINPPPPDMMNLENINTKKIFYEILKKADITIEAKSKFEETKKYFENYILLNPEVNNLANIDIGIILNSKELNQEEKQRCIQIKNLIEKKTNRKLNFPDKVISRDNYLLFLQVEQLLNYGFIFFKTEKDKINLIVKKDEIPNILKSFELNNKFSVWYPNMEVIDFFNIKFNFNFIVIITPLSFENEELKKMKDYYAGKSKEDLSIFYQTFEDTLIFKFEKTAFEKSVKDINGGLEFIRQFRKLSNKKEEIKAID